MDDEKPANIRPISSARKGKRKQGGEPSSSPPQKADLFLAVADAINQSPLSLLPPFPKRLVIYSASQGMRVIGEMGPDEVITIHENDVAAETAIMAYVNTALANREDYRWTAKTVREARDYWVMASKPLEEVAPFRWATEVGPTFNRLPWDCCQPSDVMPVNPTWDGLLRRTTNARALRHWIGSLFFPDSDTHQYVWMFGQGGDGKGAINRFLAKVFGGSYCAKQPPRIGDRFWTFGLIGKRLVAFPDCNDVRFVASGLFKSLTGGDPIDMEAKGKMSFTYKPLAKYLFFSNEKPMISSEKADTRRIIYCEFEPNTLGIEEGFEDRLWAEGGSFLTNCLVEYVEALPRRGPIPCEQAELFDHLSVVEEKFEVIFDRHLCLPNAQHRTTEGLNALRDLEQIQQVAVMPRRMQEILSYYFKNSQQAGEFIKWLEIKHGIKKKTLWLPDGREPKVYVGVAERANVSFEN